MNLYCNASTPQQPQAFCRLKYREGDTPPGHLPRKIWGVSHLLHKAFELVCATHAVNRDPYTLCCNAPAA